MISIKVVYESAKVIHCIIKAGESFVIQKSPENSGVYDLHGFIKALFDWNDRQNFSNLLRYRINFFKFFFPSFTDFQLARWQPCVCQDHGLAQLRIQRRRKS